MAFTYELIASTTISSNTAVVSFSSIPQTYTDLILKCSVRAYLNGADFSAQLNFNNSTASNYSRQDLRGNGSTISSSRNSNQAGINITNAVGGGASITANTFNSVEIYIPSYTLSQHKPISIFVANENNGTTAHLNTTAGLWRDNAAITSLQLETYAGADSTFFLYGIKNS
jgi:hypothetical protein